MAKKPKPRPEKDIQKSILTYLKLVPDVHVERVNSGMMFFDKRAIRLGSDGTADIFGVCAGRGLAIEVKRDGKDQNPAQIVWQQSWERAGGVYRVCRNIDDVDAAIRECRASKLCT